MKRRIVKKKEEILKNKNGITLIALVITVIVLLILAGVTIATLTGENGILTRAREATEETEQAKKDEKTNLSRTEDIINEYVDGVEVEQVTDGNPGVLEVDETNSNTYIINSIEDLVFFAYDVTNGNNYEGDTVKLGLSLDFNSTKSYVDPFRTDYGEYGYNGELKTLLTSGEGFKPIGTIFDTNVSTNYFYGTFDGNYNTIYNLYQNIENSNYVTIIGMFSSNNGIIKKLKLKNININAATNNLHLLLGGISGRNYKTIEQCSTSGKITVQANGKAVTYIGGLVGQHISTESIINECSSATKINVKSTNTNEIAVSGIGPAYNIKNCYFTGNILVTGNNNSGLKNISGIGRVSQGKIINCYNTGKLEAYFVNENVGDLYISGIINGKASNIENCYNIRKNRM